MRAKEIFINDVPVYEFRANVATHVIFTCRNDKIIECLKKVNDILVTHDPEKYGESRWLVTARFMKGFDYASESYELMSFSVECDSEGARDLTSPVAKSGPKGFKQFMPNPLILDVIGERKFPPDVFVLTISRQGYDDLDTYERSAYLYVGDA